ncbi:hypothetical protein J1N35_013785 [Gossypium stocksii]|uniref:Nitrate reductase n=1 Tax=Gossypium stocksii TaxID=47602 RepID=A0A9D3VUP0_9ROSI|nr:hypothetical protein J1N35_013785 [Gossypium stocksii]
MDGGETWQVCTLNHLEKPNKYGKFRCWCFWSLEVEVLDLLGAKEITVRAWDETNNTQPEKLIWNLMGMMKNTWFPVKINMCKPHKGEIGIVFEHPTLLSNQSDGWMAKERHPENQTIKKSVSSPFMNTASKTFSMSEVKKHNSADLAWIVVHGNIYDCTRFLKDHPSGTDSILINVRTDCTEEFDAIHSEKAKKMLEDYRIGELLTSGYVSDSARSSPNTSMHGTSKMSFLAPIKEVAPTRPVALVPREKIPCKLVEKTFIDDKLCTRAYTPTNSFDEVSHFDLVVKIYFKGVHPKFPNGGLMSSGTSYFRPHKGEIGIVFEHPTLPGNQSGGWMGKERHPENQTIKKSVSFPFMDTASKTFSMSEVKKHNSADSAWIVVYGNIYDCTRFLKDYPGGTDSILINTGTNCTEEFDAIHSDKAKKMLEDYRISELLTSGYVSDSARSSPNTFMHGTSKISFLAPIKEVAPTRPVSLVPRKKILCKLVEKITISHNVCRFQFALPSEDQVLGLPVGKHIFLCATIDDKLCMRAYTPTNSFDEVGHFDLVIKIYSKGVHLKFPNSGLMSQYLDSLLLGSSLDMKGPLGHIEYTGHGNFLVHGKPKFAKKLAMLASGTGITPIYQVIQAILKDPKDKTEMYFVYANRIEDDILLKEELDDWTKKHDRLKVWYVVQESISEGWQYSTGFITESVMKDHILEDSGDTLALACGPPSMI